MTTQPEQTMNDTRAPFKPTAVLIAEDTRTLLHLDSEDNSGWLYTQDEWENNREPRIYRRYGKHEGLEENERVELLPDLWIVKLDEREHWIDPMILERTSRLYGVYVFDRRQHFHLCSFEATYELHFLGSQWETSRELTDTENEELWEAIQEGDRQTEDVSYFGVPEIDRILDTPFREGFLPREGNGGMPVNELISVMADDAIEEVREAHCQSEF